MSLRDEIARLIAATPGDADYAAEEIEALLRERRADEIWWCELGYDQITECMGKHGSPCGYYSLVRLGT